MTNNMDEFEPNDHLNEPEEFPAQGGGVKANLAHAWRTQPLIKLMVLMVAVGAVAAVSFTLFSGSSSTGAKAPTTITTPPPMSEAPGGQSSQYMRDQQMKADKQREIDAAKNNGSNFITPMGDSNFVDHSKDDQITTLSKQIDDMRKEIDRKIKAPTPTPTPTPQPVQVQQVQAPEQFDDSLAKAMQKEMGELSGQWTPHGIKKVDVYKEMPEAAPLSGAHTVAAGADGSVAGANAPQQKAPKILVPAGTVSYAQLLTQANSDVPGPILAQIVSGPLNGARVVGAFQMKNAYSDYLVLRFTLAELNGKEYQINTLAVDPNTSLGGMATDVDERYFERVFLPSAAAFIQGVGSALSSGSSNVTTNGTTTIVSQSGRGLDQGLFQGAGQAANTIGQFFQNQANQTNPLVVVAAGTPMGLLFVTSVKDAPDQSLQTQQRGGFPGLGLLGGNPAPPSGLAGYSAPDPSQNVTSAYPGTTIPGFGAGASQGGVPYPNYGVPITTNPYLYNPYLQGTGASIPTLNTVNGGNYYSHP